MFFSTIGFSHFDVFVRVSLSFCWSTLLRLVDHSLKAKSQVHVQLARHSRTLQPLTSALKVFTPGQELASARFYPGAKM
jgi:hypothetical protein